MIGSEAGFYRKEDESLLRFYYVLKIEGIFTDKKNAASSWFLGAADRNRTGTTVAHRGILRATSASILVLLIILY